MRAVPVDANDNGRYDDYTIYMEEYEEYLEHYDGKDLYTHTYDGLEWGFMGVVTGLGDINGGEYLPYGWRNTMTIMQKFRENTSSDEWEMTLNEKPRGATNIATTRISVTQILIGWINVTGSIPLSASWSTC